MPNKFKTTWILIADASRARILKNDGPGLGLDAVEDMVFEGENRRVQDILADKPGRSFDSAGGGRHAMEYKSDAKHEDERAFADLLVSVLQEAQGRKHYDQLILIAPPKMLGDLRAALPEALKAVTCAEINKDLTQIPNGEMADHLKDVLAV
jgi:protein required for attachment to host cells